jgi:hypothetical protein
MRDDICTVLIRYDWEQVKQGFEKLGEPHFKAAQAAEKKKKAQAEGAEAAQANFHADLWISNEIRAAILVIERVLNYELSDDQALADVVDFYRKTRVVIDSIREANSNPPYVTLGQAIDNLANDLKASKQPNSPRLAYLAISRYLGFALQGFSEIEKQTSSWEIVVSETMVSKLRKKIVELRGDPVGLVYEEDKDIQKSIAGAIVVAQAAAQYVTGCVDYKMARKSHKQLRIVLHEVRSVYCRILCLTRDLGIRVQHGVADNIRIAIVEVARYLELSFRTFEGISSQEEDCIGELGAAWTSLNAQVTTLETEVTRWSSVQVNQTSASWQSPLTVLNTNIQQATTQITLLQGTCGDTKIMSQIGEYTNLVDDSVKQLYCTFAGARGFRMEVFDGFWESLIEIRCSLACCCREEREEQHSREEQLAKFFQLFDFLKNSTTAQANAAGGGGGAFLWQPSPSVPPATGPSGAMPMSPSAAAPTVPAQLPNYWASAQTLIASLKSISPRLSDDTAKKWTAEAQVEIDALRKGPAASNIPADILLSRSQQQWSSLYARLTVLVALQKDQDVCKKDPKLDKFAADLNSLNEKMLAALGQSVATTVSVVATGGVSS